MQFVVIVYDGKDSEALSRRLAAREAHVRLGDIALKKGEQIIGAAMLDDNN